MELDHGLARRDARAGDDGLAGVVALGGAVPEEEAVVEGWREGRRPGVVSWDVRSSTITRPGREALTYRRLLLSRATVLLLAHLGHATTEISLQVGRVSFFSFSIGSTLASASITNLDTFSELWQAIAHGRLDGGAEQQQDGVEEGEEERPCPARRGGNHRSGI